MLAVTLSLENLVVGGLHISSPFESGYETSEMSKDECVLHSRNKRRR